MSIGEGKHWLYLSLLILAVHFVHGDRHAKAAASDFVRFSAPEFLTFDELVQVSKNPNPVGPLYEKLQKLLTTPMISNEAYYRGVRPQAKEDSRLGPFMQITSWNIEKSFEIKNAIIAFTDGEVYRRLIDTDQPSLSSQRYKIAQRQQALLAQSDVIVLQEMDLGVKRSGYVDAARELAQALDMNYAYGVEYLEIDPAYLGLEKIEFDGGTADEEAMAYYRVDPKQYKGLFGSAVLSKYPIRSVEILPLRNQGYDWYWGEKKNITFFETSRRFGAKSIFKTAMHREMKVGGRIFMRVDLHVPELPQETLTIINIHLEIKCLPEAREAQMKEILEYLKNIRHPVVLAGDFNSAPGDLSPTSAVREATRTVKNPTNWLTIGIREFAPQSLLVNVTRGVSNVTKNFQNPTASHIPVLAPNKTAALFKMIEEFRFADGHVFDFRGDPARSVGGKSGVLSNSNQRDRMGYKTTFELKRTIAEVIGKYRLDWMFVKSFLNDPHDRSGPYRCAPHFGETLEEMNTILKQPISDHHPNMVSLPFEEPKIENE